MTVKKKSKKRSYARSWKSIAKRRYRRDTKKSRFKTTARKIVLSIVVGGLLLTIAGIVVASAYVARISREIPPPGTPFQTDLSPQTTYIYDRTGQVQLYKFYGDRNSEWVGLDQIPTHVRAAFLSAEDASFYSHKGFDAPGLFKVFLHEAFGIGNPRGASTVTQQLVQQTVVGREHTYERKAKELVMAMQIEQKYDKNQILEAYLNQLPFGGNIYGVQTASKAYFGKNVSELTVAEAALLAGFPQRPTYFAPPPRGSNPPLTADDARTAVGFPQNPDQYLADNVTEEMLIQQGVSDPKDYQLPANIWRQRYVLSQMEDKYDVLNSECGCAVPAEDIQAAVNQEISYVKYLEDKKAGHFVDYVKNELDEIFEEQGGSSYVETAGLRVYTSLDWDIQEKAEYHVKKIRTDLSGYGAYNSALVATDPKTGEILAMVGSIDYWGEDEVCGEDGRCKFNGQTNVVTSLRSPGSSIKPLMYLSFFENGFAPTTFLPDIPLSFGTYEPKNYERGYMGFGDVRYMLEWSRNVPAVSALSAIGAEEFANMAGRLGYTPETQDRIRTAGLSSTIGGASITMLEHAQAYSTIASGGIKRPLTAVLKVEDRDGNVIWEHDPGNGVRVVDEGYTYLVTDIIKNYRTLADVRNSGFDGRVAGKTGTNDGPRDVMFSGYSQDIVAIVWAGNNDNSKLTSGATGSKVAAEIWNSFMLDGVLAKFDNEPFKEPSGIVRSSVCADTGLSPGDSGCGTKTGIFVEGQLPPEDTYHQTLMVAPCPEQLKLASEADIVAGVAQEMTFVHYQHPDPKLQSQIDDYLGNRVPPTETCDMYRGGSGGELLVTFLKPGEGTTYKVGDEIVMEASVGTPAGINNVEFYFDDTLVKQANQAPYTAKYTISNDISAGNHTLKAKGLDSAGKTGTVTIQVKVEKELASANITSPGNNSSISKPTVNFGISVDKPNKATRLELWARRSSGGSAVLVDTTDNVNANNTLSWDISNLISGRTYNVWAVVYTGPDSSDSGRISVTIQ